MGISSPLAFRIILLSILAFFGWVTYIADEIIRQKIQETQRAALEYRELAKSAQNARELTHKLKKEYFLDDGFFLSKDEAKMHLVRFFDSRRQEFGASLKNFNPDTPEYLLLEFGYGLANLGPQDVSKSLESLLSGQEVLFVPQSFKISKDRITIEVMAMQPYIDKHSGVKR